MNGCKDKCCFPFQQDDYIDDYVKARDHSTVQTVTDSKYRFVIHDKFIGSSKFRFVIYM